MLSVGKNQLDVKTQWLSPGFSVGDGVFVKALDMALSSFNVQRQAYYGRTFVGNHVHSALEVTLYNAKYYVKIIPTSHMTVRLSALL